MNDQDLKSQHPIIHDNTEKDVILVPASVLDCKLRDFESFTIARASIAQDLALVIAFLAPVVSSDFRFFAGFSGDTIKGVFDTFAIVMFIKTVYDITVLLMKWKLHNRSALIRALHGHVEQSKSVFHSVRTAISRFKKRDDKPIIN